MSVISKNLKNNIKVKLHANQHDKLKLIEFKSILNVLLYYNTIITFMN